MKKDSMYIEFAKCIHQERHQIPHKTYSPDKVLNGLFKRRDAAIKKGYRYIGITKLIKRRWANLRLKELQERRKMYAI